MAESSKPRGSSAHSPIALMAFASWVRVTAPVTEGGRD